MGHLTFMCARVVPCGSNSPLRAISLGIRDLPFPRNTRQFHLLFGAGILRRQ